MCKKALIICFSDLSKDPRPYRQISWLKDDYDVTAVGCVDPKIDNVRFIEAGIMPTKMLVTGRGSSNDNIFTHFIRPYLEFLFLKLRFYEKAYWKSQLIKLKNMLLQEKFDIVIANDLNTLPFAIESTPGAKIIFDDHEGAFRHFEDSFLWRFFLQKYYKYFLKKYLPKVDRMITVCEPIAKEYEKVYGILPEVITNATEYVDLQPSEVGEKIRIIHHGIASPQRNIEGMIKMMDYLDERFTLDLFLIGHFSYIKKLTKKAGKNKRIKFLPPLRRVDLVNYTNRYDIGLHLLKNDRNFTKTNALPNKVFEFIQARLAVIVNNYPEVDRILKKYDCGKVINSFDPKILAQEVNKLTKDDIIRFKNNSNLAAKDLTTDNNEIILKNIVKNLTN